VQELHLVALHAVCAAVDAELGVIAANPPATRGADVAAGPARTMLGDRA
jgi:hypothetical protein